MSTSSLVFGDVFESSEKKYIFLVKSEHAIYAASILTPNLTQQLNTLAERRTSQNKGVLNTQILYCYVILTTSQYQNQAAHIRPGSDNFIEYKKLGISITLNDQRAILEEIKTTRAISIELKELCKDLELN